MNQSTLKESKSLESLSKIPGRTDKSLEQFKEVIPKKGKYGETFIEPTFKKNDHGGSLRISASKNDEFERKLNSTFEDLKKIKRTAIPSSICHQVQLRDKGRCTYVDDSRERCLSQRFLEMHHILPISKGGGHFLKNITLLCSGHHKAEHLKLELNKGD